MKKSTKHFRILLEQVKVAALVKTDKKIKKIWEIEQIENLLIIRESRRGIYQRELGRSDRLTQGDRECMKVGSATTPSSSSFFSFLLMFCFRLRQGRRRRWCGEGLVEDDVIPRRATNHCSPRHKISMTSCMFKSLTTCKVTCSLFFPNSLIGISNLFLIYTITLVWFFFFF